MSDLYSKSILTYTTSITPSEINKNINQTLKNKIINDVEGKCINGGYVKKNSIKIISRSTGQLLVSQFNGDIIYHIKYSADLCNPLEDAIIKGEVVNINKMGILASGGEDDPKPLSILVAKQHHINNENFDKIKVGDKIKVKVLGKRFEFGDSQINIIGILDASKEAVVEVGAIKYYSKSKDYKWLSAFNLANPFTYKSRIYATVEHAFHAQKSDNTDYKNMLTKDGEKYIGDDAKKAKTFGGKKNFEKLEIDFVDDWNDTRVTIMRDITDAYYNANYDMTEKLVETGTAPLIHKGFAVDDFWGVKPSMKGENNHGKILMELREKYMNE
jgi:ribA/ribD-fused uncharacterized protein